MTLVDVLDKFASEFWDLFDQQHLVRQIMIEMTTTQRIATTTIMLTEMPEIAAAERLLLSESMTLCMCMKKRERERERLKYCAYDMRWWQDTKWYIRSST